MAFDKENETTFKLTTPAAKTFLTRKVPQLEWDFADFAVLSSIPLGNITSYESQLRQHSGVIMCDPRATIFVLPDFNEDQSKLMCKCNVIKCSTEVRDKGVAVNGTLMKIQAKKLSGGVDSYKASNGWISCLKKRYGMSNRRKTSAAQKLPEDLDLKVLSFQRMIQLREQYDYPMCDVFNMDETPLTFDMPSDWTIDYTGKKDCKKNNRRRKEAVYGDVRCDGRWQKTADFGQSIHRAGMSFGSSMSTQPSSNKWKGTLSFSASETQETASNPTPVLPTRASNPQNSMPQGYETQTRPYWMGMPYNSWQGNHGPAKRLHRPLNPNIQASAVYSAQTQRTVTADR
ncbi:hypothetical protein Bbelb_283500 [Branchiostoma belcheri]|nr:hypothetical protein Bbelb_283500 [Branchiostoma belcheri]